MVMVAAAAPAGPTTLRLAVNVSGAVNRRDSPRRCCGAETDKAVNASVMTSGNQDMDESPRETDENASRRGYPTEEATPMPVASAWSGGVLRPPGWLCGRIGVGDRW